MIGNLLKYVCAKISENSRSYCKSKTVHFLAYTVEAVFIFSLFNVRCVLSTSKLQSQDCGKS